MAKFVLVFIVIVVGVVAFFNLTQTEKVLTKKDSITPITSTSSTPTQKAYSRKSSIFIPYWINVNKIEDLSQYDRIIYFGVSPNSLGLNKADEGYLAMPKIMSHIDDKKEQIMTLRMLDSDSAQTIVGNESSWRGIIDETLSAAKSNGFDGVLIDLEVSALPFSDLSSQITKFLTTFSREAKARSLTFSVAIYGDTFYRKRPYDVQAISQNADEVMVMAYDLHKSRGEPGPNFPLGGADKYGYDLRSLISDLRGVPTDKLTFIFGMYGYDWGVDETKKPIRPAKALSDLDIKDKFIDHCQWKNCTVIPDADSAETEINYIDENLLYHIVWFEDARSVVEKQKFLESQGIGSVAYWVYGYF